MKLHVAGVLSVLAASFFMGGCGPGLGHHGKYAKAPEPPNAVGTTTLYSAPAPLPDWLPTSPSGLSPLATWEEDAAPAEPKQTWGNPSEAPTPEQLAEYGF